MRSLITLLVAAASLLATLVLLACAGAPATRDISDSGSVVPADGRPMVNRIAYVNNTGDLLLLDPDGSNERRLTGDARAGVLAQSLQRGDSYSWPTWSPDGSRVAASRVSVSGSGAGLSVQVYDLATGSVSSAYENEVPVPVADGTPHYIYWSPDGRYLSFLAPTPEGLTLFVGDWHSREEPGAVAVGAPLYYHWTPDSGLLAVHSGESMTVQEPSPEGEETRIAVDAVSFRAPAVSPDGSTVAYAGIGGGVRGVFASPTLPGAGDAATLLMETQGLTSFSWAPDGSTLAVAEQLHRGVPVFDRLQLVAADGSRRTTLVEDQLVAFFWSPQGENIAWVGIDPQSRAMDLSVSAVEAGTAAGEPRRLFRFSPTGEMFTWLSFFDQYAYSHSLWSPDGSAIVVAGNDGLESGRRNGSGPSGGYVYVVDVSSGEAHRIASGKVAVWSWN